MHQLTMNRRDLLKVVGVGALGAMLPACGAPMSRSRLIRTQRRFAIPKIFTITGTALAASDCRGELHTWPWKRPSGQAGRDMQSWDAVPWV